MWATVARASSLDWGQPAKRNSQLLWRLPHHLGASTPRPKRLRIVVCAGVGGWSSLGVLPALAAQLPQEGSKVTWESACKPGACPVRSVSWDVHPLQPITSLKHQPREHTRPGLVDEVTGGV